MTEANFQVQGLKRRTGAAHFPGNEAAPPPSEKSNRMHEARTGAGVLKPRADSITATLAVRALEELANAMAAIVAVTEGQPKSDAGLTVSCQVHASSPVCCGEPVDN